IGQNGAAAERRAPLAGELEGWSWPDSSARFRPTALTWIKSPAPGRAGPQPWTGWRRESCSAVRRIATQREGRAGATRQHALPADVEQLHFEHQRRTGRDHPAGAVLAVSQPRRNMQLALAAAAHSRDAFVPAEDDAARAQAEHERLSTIPRTVELLAAPVRCVLVVEPAGVVHADLVARGRRVAFPNHHVDALQLGHVATRIGRWPAAGGKQQERQRGGELERAKGHGTGCGRSAAQDIRLQAAAGRGVEQVLPVGDTSASHGAAANGQGRGARKSRINGRTPAKGDCMKLYLPLLEILVAFLLIYLVPEGLFRVLERRMRPQPSRLRKFVMENVR